MQTDEATPFLTITAKSVKAGNVPVRTHTNVAPNVINTCGNCGTEIKRWIQALIAICQRGSINYGYS